MTVDTLRAWHRLVRSRSAGDLGSLLAEGVVFHSPVVYAPLAGKAIVQQYLAAALHVFVNDSFRYVRELAGPRDAALEFEVEIDGIGVNGIDLIDWDDQGRIVELKVLIRPLKAVNLIHHRMAAMLPKTP